MLLPKMYLQTYITRFGELVPNKFQNGVTDYPIFILNSLSVMANSSEVKYIKFAHRPGHNSSSAEISFLIQN